MTRNWRSTPRAVFVSSRLMAFTPGRAKCLLSMTKSSSPFIFRHSRKNTRAARILNMPCATQWIFQRLAAPHIADWITAISANYAWPLVLPRQRRFAGQHAEQTAQNAPLNLQTLEAISESVLQDVAPRSSWRASKEFRLHLIQTMTKKVISEAVAAAGENCNESQRNNYHRMHH